MTAEALDLTGFVEVCAARVAAHALDRPGAYRRHTRAGPDGARNTGLNPYGCADAANILYTLGRLPRARDERDACISVLRSLQSERDGLFRDATHDPIHTTAHCVAALELFDAGPAHPLSGLAAFRDPGAVEVFLEALDWAGNPWIASHRGAGLYAALHIAGETDPDWEARYFAWLDRQVDPDTGLDGGAALPPGEARDPWLFPSLAGTFHYTFNRQHARRALPHPEALIDTCLDIQARRLFPLSSFVGFAEIDWVYCLNRAHRQSEHRCDEARAALRHRAAAHVAFLQSLAEGDDALDDLHGLFGTLCALAELQQALPGELYTERPLRLVLDRRPFI